MENKEKREGKVVVMGASPNPARYSFLAANLLKKKGYPIIPLGTRRGEAGGEPIMNVRERPPLEGVDTITLYLRAERQKEWYDYLLGMTPRRIIFNPGAENPEFEKLARDRGVETVEGCTLVMLRTHQF